MKSTTKKTLSNMRKLRLSFEPLVKKPAQAEELAFHLGDIQGELVLVSKILHKIVRNQRASKADLNQILYHVGVHWPYHVAKIKLLAAKLDGR